MTVLNRAMAALVMRASAKDRAEARVRAIGIARAGDWLSQVLDHHRRIESAFARLQHTRAEGERRLAERWLASLLAAHERAEAVLYPELARGGHAGQAASAEEQHQQIERSVAALAAVETLSQGYSQRLARLQGEVLVHLYQEETSWFYGLKLRLTPSKHAELSDRFREAFDRATDAEGGAFGSGTKHRDGPGV